MVYLTLLFVKICHSLFFVYIAWQAMSEDERKAQSEKEREQRRAAQQKALEELRKENEAAAIASVRYM